MNEDGLAGGPGDYDRIELPYEPPEEYDLRVTFARTSGNYVVEQLCRLGEGGFHWETGCVDPTGFSFTMLEGPKVVRDRLNFPDRPLLNGRKYVSAVLVRKDRVSGFVDGKFVGDFQPGQYKAHIYWGWALRRPECLGLGVSKSTVIFYSVDLTEISGHGRIVP